MARLQFGLWALGARFRDPHRRCPYCGSILHTTLQRKKILIEARKCQYCSLIFRWPADSPKKAAHFYEAHYESGHITDLPTAEEIADVLAGCSETSRFNGERYMRLVRDVYPPPAHLLDFGASWGYVAAQLRRVGYKVEGFELSRPRAEFGRNKLQITMHSSWEELWSSPLPRFGVVFAAHTLEHVYDLKSTLQNISSAMVSGGALVVVVPNGGGAQARRLGVGWGPYLGETHTIAFTAEWFSNNLPRHGFCDLQLFSPGPTCNDRQCDGEELICIARRCSN